jgi:WD40 repeat protein
VKRPGPIDLRGELLRQLAEVYFFENFKCVPLSFGALQRAQDGSFGMKSTQPPENAHMRRLICAACLLWAVVVQGAEPPTDPILRIDAGMHTGPIFHIAVDARSRWLVTASYDKTARVWDLTTGRLQNVIRPPIGTNDEGRLYGLAMSPDGEVVALGGWTQFNDGQPGLAPEGEAILLFDRATGRMLRRIEGLTGVIYGLAYSPDGRYLAATLAGTSGIRVFKADSGDLVAQDTDYGADSYCADFSRDGRLVTSSYDGYVRLYRLDKSGLHLAVKAPAPGGKRPYGVRFSPDGRLIAVGFEDSVSVSVLDSGTLALRYAPQSPGPKDADLTSVVWSSDGQFLYAAGSLGDRDIEIIRQWPQAGQAPPRDALAATNTVMDLKPLPQGVLVYASGNPDWGLLDANGQRQHFMAAPTADLRDFASGFLVSHDGRAVRFSFKDRGTAPARFDLDQGLGPDDTTSASLAAPRTSGPGMSLAQWRNATPQLNGRPLTLEPYEASHSVAITPDGQRVALGADFSVYLFNGSGEQLWRAVAPAPAWAVNVSGDGQTVVAALGDGTIRWYDIRDGHEKLAFFPHADRKRWVVWTPSGYYQASPGGEDLIGWHLNHGRAAAADFFPASRLRSKFNRPDVIAHALGSPSEAEALRLANAESGRRSDATASSVQTLLPPVVEILSPQDGSAVVKNSVTVRYATRTPPDAPVTGLRARVNGQPISLPDTRGLAVVGSDNAREIAIPIHEQNSEIQLFAENKNGVSTPALLRVAWSGTPQASAQEGMYKPKLYVLAVGVAKYANPSFNLELPAKDARDFANVLLKQKGELYADVQVRLLTDADAAKDNVLDGLDWLQHQVTARDVGMMFLAGHGMNDNTGKYYFLPYNADPEKLLRTGVPQADIRDTLSSLAGKAVFFVDTCHSGNAIGTAKTRGLDNGVDAFVSDLASAENGVVVFTASTGRQFSLEDPAWGNGAFTKAVVEGLGGKADFQKSGRITLKGLDYYVAERVKQLTGGRQSPVSIAPSGVSDFPIAVAGRP